MENHSSDIKPVKIRNWSVCSHDSDYVAPELATHYLNGEVYGHPKQPDGKRVDTSYIKWVTGKLVTTASRVYELDGPPNEEYMKYLQAINRVYDPENPIKVITIN